MANFISKLIKARHLLIPPTSSAPQFKKVTPYMDFKLVDQTAVNVYTIFWKRKANMIFYLVPPFFPVLFCYLSEFHMIRKNAKSLLAYVQSYFMLSQVFAIRWKISGKLRNNLPASRIQPLGKMFFLVQCLCSV